MEEVYIISAVRTPLGSFGGSLSGLTAVQLGAEAIKAAVAKARIAPADVQEVFMGNVLSANLGQAPARQAALGSGLPHSIPCTTINKVCASGMKAVMIAAQAIMTGQQEVIVAGGMESMSNVPFYVPKARFGYKYGNAELVDGLAKDGLHEVYYDFPMGNCAENTAKAMGISRAEQDAYAIQSYQRATEASEKGAFKEEIVPVEVKDRKGASSFVTEDEEFRKVDYQKIAHLKPVFEAAGTVTAANASTMNDGASALVLMSRTKAQALGVTPIARIRGFGDAAQDPVWFTTAPALAIPKALRHAGLSADEVDYYEINEAFATVAIANQRQLGIPDGQLNIYGGAIALGHPLGCSGARIITTLNTILAANKATYGVAAVCNGGGGASAIVIERL
jgi:acetyl-CoA C-acetyltransferase